MTIKDIAKYCGVSVSTVSRVLNNRPDVSDTVREKILLAVEEKGYIPNNSARDLVRTKSDTIGVIVRGIGNLFFADMLKVISEEIDRAGYTMVLHFIDSDADEVKAGAVLEREKKLRGLIFLGGRYDYTPSELSYIGVPFVCCSYTNCFGSLDDESYCSVSVDDHATAYKAVEHLINLGHKKIAALVPSCDDRSISQLRYKGYCDALSDNGIELDGALVIQSGGDYDIDSNFGVMTEFLKNAPEFTALFALSDTLAMAAIKALENSGKAVPGDVSVIAIDGLNVSNYFTPTLTTMVQPAEEMGRQSVKLISQMLSQEITSRHLILEAAIRPGASVAPYGDNK